MPFIPTGNGNEILDGDGFFVSYNPNPAGGNSLCTMLGKLAAVTTGDGAFAIQQPETALVVDGKFMILNGDFRQDYEGLVPQGLEACKTFFKSQDDVSVWSTRE